MREIIRIVEDGQTPNMTKEEAEDIIAEWERRGYDYD